MNPIEYYITTHTPRLACTLYAWKHGKDKEYIARAMRTDPMVMKVYSYGDLNPDKIFYYIRMDSRGSGFYAEYNNVLKYLAYADRFGLIPVVEYTNNNLYYEKEPVNGTMNPFEYFFLQPGGISISDVKKSKNVIRAEYVHTKTKDIIEKKKNDYSVTEDYIQYLAPICEKYIHYNDTVCHYVSDQLSMISVDNSVIGVHYRGTDFKRQLRNHPHYVPLEEYIISAGKLMETGHYDRIFLATDDEEGITCFRERFGAKVICYSDAYRADKDVSVAFISGKRSLHRYNLGLEVIRDMEALSECGALVAGLSQVALAARVNNQKKHGGYKDEIIMDRGVVKSGGDSSKKLEEIRREMSINEVKD